jgi:Leucine-rich repeat (LRR) protein
MPSSLRYLNLSSNRIKVLGGVSHLKYLLVLNLNDNEIQKIEGKGIIFQVKGMVGLDNNFSLLELYLADNFLKRAENLEFQQQLEW